MEACKDTADPVIFMPPGITEIDEYKYPSEYLAQKVFDCFEKLLQSDNKKKIHLLTNSASKKVSDF